MWFVLADSKGIPISDFLVHHGHKDKVTFACNCVLKLASVKTK